MPTKIFAVLLLTLLVFSACNEDIEFKFISPKKISIDKELRLSVKEMNGRIIDSLHFYLDGKKVSSENNSAFSIKDQVLGIHSLRAILFYEGNSKTLNNSIYFLADTSPSIYTYKIINTFPHDADAFTQGLEYKDGFLYESTGQNGASSIRKTALKTGEVLQIKALDKKYFGEGITIFDSKIYQLTWRGNIGFVYDLESFELLNSFPYNKSKEGWGLTHNDKELIKSDGTERIWFLDPATQKETHYIEAYTNKRKAESLNEIEYINGKIYANIWQKNTIIIINAENGTIEGVANLNGLRAKINKPDAGKTYVLNGIAYDKEKNRLFVTGKNWDKTFEIELIKK